MYVRNQLREEYLEKLYVASAGDNKNLELQQNKHHLEYWNKMYEKYVSIVGEYEGNNRNILDVGCGIGSFLGFLKSARGGRHYSLHGLELNAAAADYVKKIVGEKCFYDKPLGTFALDKTFGSIYLWG
ncbi:MAG: class I SAM-dependent methyltransferase, partial [bacterium]|nr:class I SAM-dependent methyltransferase [bacterium]